MMMNIRPTKTLNRKMLILCREIRKLTQKELAAAVGIAQGTLSKWENGNSEPDDDQLQALAKALKFRPQLLSSDLNRWSMASNIHHRKLKSVPARDRASAEGEGRLRSLHLARLRRSAEYDVSLPDLELKDFDSMEDYVRAVRGQLELPPGPIPSMTKLLEKMGVVVMLYDFGVEKMDGFYISGLLNQPAICVNSAVPTDRLRFSLAHELGHLLMHNSIEPENEDEANAFAAELLAPGYMIRHELRDPTLGRLRGLKERWGVSIQALVIRAYDLECITEARKKALFIQISARGWRKNEPGELEHDETPKLLSRLIQFHLDELSYTEVEMAELLDLELDEYRKMYAHHHRRKAPIKLFDFNLEKERMAKDI